MSCCVVAAVRVLQHVCCVLLAVPVFVLATIDPAVSVGIRHPSILIELLLHDEHGLNPSGSCLGWEPHQCLFTTRGIQIRGVCLLHAKQAYVTVGCHAAIVMRVWYDAANCKQL
eukprot:1161835-Pelagomonas_calceolata.AAC.12